MDHLLQKEFINIQGDGQFGHLVIRPVWLNGWVFVYELSSCRFESSCNASIHQKRKPSSVENSSASESTEKQKNDTSKKDNLDESKKKKKKTAQAGPAR